MATKVNSLDEKFKEDKLEFNQVTNEDLVCKDCTYVWPDNDITGNTSKCDMYSIKPSKVLKGGECDEYEKFE